MTRKIVAGIGLALILAVTAICGVAAACPAAAAVVCPRCYGFATIDGGVYAEAGTDPAKRAVIAGILNQARDRVGTFYGGLRSTPTILVCATQECYRRVGGGGSRGMAVLDRALFLSPRGTDAVIAAHELAHIELHYRVGLVKAARRVVPQWFDEGLAVTVSDDPRYLAATTVDDRCLVAPDGSLPAQRSAWIETAASHDLYAKAACRVSRWLKARGGSRAAIALADSLARGEVFDDVYGRP